MTPFWSSDREQRASLRAIYQTSSAWGGVEPADRPVLFV